jgi:hypothetical protein
MKMSEAFSTFLQASAESVDEGRGDMAWIRALNRCVDFERSGLGENFGVYEVDHQTETPAQANTSVPADIA